MREHRWESRAALTYQHILSVQKRLAQMGLRTTQPDQDGICYVEEFSVRHWRDLELFDPWPTEDTTFILVLDKWQGDFYIMVGQHHTIFKQYESVHTYCSISHPWRLQSRYATLHPQAMFWVGFRHTHSFIRVRFDTVEVITPGETVADASAPYGLMIDSMPFRQPFRRWNSPSNLACPKVWSRYTRAIPIFPFSAHGRTPSAPVNSSSTPQTLMTSWFQPANSPLHSGTVPRRFAPI